MTLSRRELFTLGGGLLIASTAPARPASASVLRGSAFGTSWQLVTPEPVGQSVLPAAIDAIIQSVDRAMSPFRPDSQISRFNRFPTTDWQPVSSGLSAVVDEALRVAAMTSGAFNPTVGPIVGRLGFGPIKGTVHGQAWEIALQEGNVRKYRPGLSLDLCGVAKGHALDRMAAACEAHGLVDYLFELGGEVVAKGRHPAGRRWRIGIERPVPGPASLQQAVTLDGMALATSGNTINSYRVGGRLYSHIIDPATGEPADSALVSVSVLANTAMRADALATALFVMGSHKGPAFANEAGIDALFLVEEGDTLRETVTADFSAHAIF